MFGTFFFRTEMIRFVVDDDYDDGDDNDDNVLCTHVHFAYV